MEKLRLNLALGAEEILTRDELRKIFGGLGSDSDVSYSCKCDIQDKYGHHGTVDVTTLDNPTFDNCKLGCAYQCKVQILNGKGCVGWSYSFTGPKNTGS